MYKPCAQGIEKWCSGLPSPRAPAGSRTPASVSALFRWGWSSAQARESFTASRWSYPRTRIERSWAGNGLATTGVLGRLWWVEGRSPELRASSGKLSGVRRRWSGRWPSTRVGFIATRGHDTGVGAGATEGVRGCACGRALGALPSVCPRRTRGGLLLPVFNGLFGRLSVQISAKILCTVSSLHHILSFLSEFQAKIWLGLRDIGVWSWLCPSCPNRDKNRAKSCQPN
jgi:hypothetical protein